MQFLKKLNHLLEEFTKNLPDLMGDFNINLDPIKSMLMAKQYINMQLSNGMVPCITKQTIASD